MRLSPDDEELFPTIIGAGRRARFGWGGTRTLWPDWVAGPANWVLCGLFGCDHALSDIVEDYTPDGRYSCIHCPRLYVPGAPRGGDS